MPRPRAEPYIPQLLSFIDTTFQSVEDKDTMVTTGCIYSLVESHHGWNKVDKKRKRVIRSHLVDLMTGDVNVKSSTLTPNHTPHHLSSRSCPFLRLISSLSLPQRNAPLSSPIFLWTVLQLSSELWSCELRKNQQPTSSGLSLCCIQTKSEPQSLE